MTTNQTQAPTAARLQILKAQRSGLRDRRLEAMQSLQQMGQQMAITPTAQTVGQMADLTALVLQLDEQAAALDAEIAQIQQALKTDEQRAEQEAAAALRAEQEQQLASINQQLDVKGEAVQQQILRLWAEFGELAGLAAEALELSAKLNKTPKLPRVALTHTSITLPDLVRGAAGTWAFKAPVRRVLGDLRRD